MTDQPDRRSFQALFKWATTPPQSFAVYALLVILVGGLSFIAGTLKPKHAPPTTVTIQPKQ